MAAAVASYYCWPAATAIFSRLAAWQHAGGVLYAGLAMAFAGGILSELSLIYFQNKGRWTAAHLDNMVFKTIFFFVNGSIVYEFYTYQTYWFGEGTAWSVLLPKIMVDQLIYSVIWSLPFQTFLFRWHHLRYSGRRLWMELDWSFVVERMLPILITNWMFWIPGVLFIYSMPSVLQMPLAIFATAIWSVLLSAVARHDEPDASATMPGLVPEVAIESADDRASV